MHPAAEHHRALLERHLPRISACQFRPTVQAQDFGAARKRPERVAQVLVEADVLGATRLGPERDLRTPGSHRVFDKVSWG